MSDASPSVAPGYRGRFAPSPTGTLHFGSLVAAMGSYLDARAQGGEWLVRMEDLDQTRTLPGAADAILRTLDALGFEWDGAVAYQSRRTQAYAQALERLRQAGLVYPCGCSRKQIQRSARLGPEGPIYPGNCRRGLAAGVAARSLRLRVPDQTCAFEDRIQGRIEQNLARQVGDFVVQRADGFHAYQLAVVVDDGWQGINRVVRGADLLLSTPRQIYLQRLLGLDRPDYAHLPLVVDRTGRKLSKQSRDAPVERRRPLPVLLQALEYLGQPLPEGLPTGVDEFWRWAIAHWSIRGVGARLQQPLLRSPQAHAGI